MVVTDSMDLYEVHWNNVTSYKYVIEAHNHDEAQDMALEMCAADYDKFELDSDVTGSSVDWIGVDAT